MVKPAVWAPNAESVHFVVAGEFRQGFERDGHWTCPVEILHGTPYAVSLNGGPPSAEPNALDVPQGLRGSSRAFDVSQLRWTDSRFCATPWDEAVVYELHVGTFTTQGTLDAAIQRLGHLVNLGVTHVELMPLNTFAGRRGWGYDGVLLFAVHPVYGGPAGLARFVDAAHAHGLAVILDVVYNHVGPGSDMLSQWAPYFDASRKTPWGPSFDFTRPNVRRFVCDNALLWLRDFHIDGLRLDAVQTIFDPSDLHILSQLNDEIRQLSRQMGRDHVVIAETVLNERRMVQPRTQGGHGYEAHWHEDFHHALHAALTGERFGYYADFGPLSRLAHVLTQGYWFDGTRHSHHHGAPFGESSRGIQGTQLVAYLQTHDQVGNRADGARITDLVGDAAKIGSALTLLGPFIPMLWQGEEWGASRGFHFFCDHEPKLGAAVAQGRRNELRAFGFDVADMLEPQSSTTFDQCVLDWSELEQEPHTSMLAWTRELLRIRASLGGAAAPASIHVDVDEEAEVLTLHRGSVRVVANFSSDPAKLDLQDQAIRLASWNADEGEVALPPRSVAVLA